MKKIHFLCLAMTLLTVNIAFAADEIHWTVTGKDSVTFDWRGASAEKSIGYGLTSGNYTQVVTATAPNPVPVSSSGPFWEAKLTGLTANTRYYYKIGTGPERSFRTGPAPGSSDFNVYAMGNIGSSSTYFNTGVVQDLIANDLPSLVVGLGDLTLGNINGKATIDQHFNDVMVWSTQAAYMPVWGDMDTISSRRESFKNYKGRFAVPNSQTSPGSPLAGGEDWYWFDYGNVRFITLPEPWSGALTDWNTKAIALMDQAQSDPTIKFIVTFVHKPAYSSGHYTGSSTLKSMLDALGDTHSKYQLNVNAHSNNYERSFPQHGVTHVTAGTGGANLTQDGTCLWLTCTKPSWSAFRTMHLGALKLNFTASGIEGSFICGPAGGGINDVTCTTGSVVDRFVIGTLPVTISAVSAFDITQTGANITWTLSAPGTGQIEYGTTTLYGQMGAKETTFQYSTHVQTLSGLTPNTQYHFRVHSSNQEGVESVSKDFTFTTTSIPTVNPLPIKGPTITAVSAFDITKTDAKITWTLNEPSTGQVEYGTTTLYGQTSVKETSFNYSTHIQPLSGLAPGTLYHFRVRSTNQAGVESVSGDFTFTTAVVTTAVVTPTPTPTPTPTSASSHAPPPTSSLVVNVRNTGATGNGVTNDTAAIQAAVNQVGGTGGTVLVPDGTYMIDALTSLDLKSNMTFKMTSGAILKAITNNQPGYTILRSRNGTNVNIIGGTISGERSTHTGTGGEWGMCLSILSSSNVYVDTVTSKDCWGDGFYIGNYGGAQPTNVTIDRVVADNNRRCGLALVHGKGIIIKDSVFKNTNGTSPQVGIDVEPDSDTATNNIQILNSEFINNAVVALELFGGSVTADKLTNVTISGNRIYGGVGGYGIGINRTSNHTITNNTVATNYIGLSYGTSTGNAVTNNVLCAPTPINGDTGGNTYSGNTLSAANCRITP